MAFPRIPLILLGAAALALPTTGQSQVSLGVGPSFPMGTLADEAEIGHHVRASAEVGLPAVPFRLRTDLFYQRFNSVEREPSVYTSLGGEWYRQAGVMVNGIYELGMNAPVRPYVLVGGAYLREWHGDRTYSGTKHYAFSLNAGVGLNVTLFEGMALFVEAPFQNVLGGTSLPTNPPAVLDEVQFRSVPVTIGVRL